LKPKRIVIFYAKQFFGSEARAERVYYDVINEIKNEGKEVKYTNRETTMFTDGTKVDKVPFGRSGLLGLRVTHCYVDRYILTLENSNDFIVEAVMPFVVEGDYKHLDADGKAIDRIMVFDNKGIDKLSNFM